MNAICVIVTYLGLWRYWYSQACSKHRVLNLCFWTLIVSDIDQSIGARHLRYLLVHVKILFQVEICTTAQKYIVNSSVNYVFHFCLKVFSWVEILFNGVLPPSGSVVR